MNAQPRTVRIDAFAGFNEVDKREIEILTELGAYRVIIGLDNQDDDRRGIDRTDYDDDWEPRVQLQGGRLERSYERLLNAGFEVGAHWWMRPVDKWEEQARTFMLDLAGRYYGNDPFTAVADVELFALHMRVIAKHAGYPTFEAFVQAWGNRWLRPGPSVEDLRWPRLAVAVYAKPNPRSVIVAAHVAVLETITMGYGNVKLFGPELPARRLIPDTIEDWSAHLREGQLLTLGMGAYDQARGDYDDREVMISSAKAAAARGIDRLIYWQLESFDGANWTHAERRAAIKAAGRMQVTS